MCSCLCPYTEWSFVSCVGCKGDLSPSQSPRVVRCGLWRWPHSENPRLPKAIADIGRGLLRSSYNPSTPHVSCWRWCYVALIGIPRQFFLLKSIPLSVFSNSYSEKGKVTFLKVYNYKQNVIKPFVTVITTSKEGVWPFALTMYIRQQDWLVGWVEKSKNEICL